MSRDCFTEYFLDSSELSTALMPKNPAISENSGSSIKRNSNETNPRKPLSRIIIKVKNHSLNDFFSKTIRIRTITKRTHMKSFTKNHNESKKNSKG